MSNSSRRRMMSLPFLLIVLLAISAAAVIADSAGPRSPGTTANDISIGTVAWSTPERARASDNSRATATLGDNAVSNFLKATNFSFSIPPGATITGITVDVERSAANAGSPIHDAAVSIVKNGVIQAADRATATNWTGTDTYEMHGGATDLWGTMWTPADVNNAGFGVAVAATKAGTAGGNRNARIDVINITVYYTPDTTPPVVTVPADMIVEATGISGAIVVFPATANDNIDGSITPTCVPASGSTFALGTTTVNCTATDGAGNTGSASFTITAQDTTAPIITLVGSDPETIEVGTPYSDAGATALDVVDGDLTGLMATFNPVDSNIVGTYTVTYNVADSAGNDAAEVTRTVNVVDTTPPVITLNGASPVTLEIHTAYTDAGATAWDNVDGNITGSILTAGNVNTNVLGTYAVTYDVNDSAGNPGVQVTRNVSVIDTTPPVITLRGGSVTIDQWEKYEDAGATAFDNADGDITGAIVAVIDVKTGITGTQVVTYHVNDSSGNTAEIVSRAVDVVRAPHTGLGKYAFSYFADQSAQSAPAQGAESAAAVSAESQSAGSAESQAAGMPGVESSAAQAVAAQAPAGTAPAESGIAGAEAAQPGNEITGAVTGTNRNTNAIWLATAGIIIASLLSAAWGYWRQKRKLSE